MRAFFRNFRPGQHPPFVVPQGLSPRLEQSPLPVTAACAGWAHRGLPSRKKASLCLNDGLHAVFDVAVQTLDLMASSYGRRGCWRGSAPAAPLHRGGAMHVTLTVTACGACVTSNTRRLDPRDRAWGRGPHVAGTAREVLRGEVQIQPNRRLDHAIRSNLSTKVGLAFRSDHFRLATAGSRMSKGTAPRARAKARTFAARGADSGCQRRAAGAQCPPCSCALLSDVQPTPSQRPP